MSDFVTTKILKEELDRNTLKIFKYFDAKFKETRDDFNGLRQDFSKLNSAVDAYAKQVEVYYQESLARDAQVNRIQGWVEQIAQKTGVKLEY